MNWINYPILCDMYHYLIIIGTYRRLNIEFCDMYHLTDIEGGVILCVVKEELTKIENG